MPIEAPPSSPDWLFRTLSWTSPAWPIGSFAFSSGIEYGVEAGRLRTFDDVRDWLRQGLTMGSLRADAQVFAHCWTAARSSNPGEVAALAELALAAQISAERALESTAQGSAFRRAAVAANAELEPDLVRRYADVLSTIGDADLPLPVAAATLFSVFNVPRVASTIAFLHGQLANLVSAAQRSVPLGHTDAQRLIAALGSDVQDAALEADRLVAEPFAETLFSASHAADIATMLHETQYTRLFRS